MKFCPECGCSLSVVSVKTETESQTPNLASASKTIVDMPIKAFKISISRFGWKSWSFMIIFAMLIHAILITSGLPSYLWVVSMDAAAGIAYTEYTLFILGLFFLMYKFLTRHPVSNSSDNRKRIIRKEL